jgi:alpha-tubulin suppressor-like RCC1 family protein
MLACVELGLPEIAASFEPSGPGAFARQHLAGSVSWRLADSELAGGVGPTKCRRLWVTNDAGYVSPASAAGFVDVGGSVLQVAAGYSHTCALLEGGNVRCWGTSLAGVLGYGNLDTVGDDESPAFAGDVDVGAAPCTS